MEGVITRVGRFISIIGDDDVEYIGFFQEMKDKNDKKYCWRGNRCSFTPEDQGGEHMVAAEMEPVRELDPLRFQKAARKQEERARHEQNMQQKAEKIAKQKERERWAAEREAYEADHLRYVLFRCTDGDWEPAEPYVIEKSYDDAKAAMIHYMFQHDDHSIGDGSPRILYGVRKQLVYEVYGKIIFKEPEKRKH